MARETNKSLQINFFWWWLMVVAIGCRLYYVVCNSNQITWFYFRCRFLLFDYLSSLLWEGWLVICEDRTRYSREILRYTVGVLLAECPKGCAHCTLSNTGVSATCDSGACRQGYLQKTDMSCEGRRLWPDSAHTCIPTSTIGCPIHW